MAIVEIDFLYPKVIMPNNGIVTQATVAFDSTGDVQSWICQAAEDMTITQVGCYISAKTGRPGDQAGSLRLGICYVDGTNGFPTANPPVWANATFSGAAGTAYQDFNADTIAVASNLIATLTTAVTITRGTVFAVALDALAGTWVAGSDFLTVRTGWNNTYPFVRRPYSVGRPAGSYVDNDVNIPAFLYRTSTKSFGYPYNTVVSLNVNNGSTPDEFGMYFQMPAGTCASYQIAGLRLGCLPAADFDVLLYGTDGTTVLASMAYDSSIQNQTAQAAFDCMFTGTTLPTLNAGSFYRLVVRPSTINNMGPVQYFTFSQDSDKTAVIGSTADIQYTSRTNAGAWTQDTNRMLTMQAIIVGLDQGTGSAGGMLVHPGMTGGIHG